MRTSNVQRRTSNVEPRTGGRPARSSAEGLVLPLRASGELANRLHAGRAAGLRSMWMPGTGQRRGESVLRAGAKKGGSREVDGLDRAALASAESSAAN